MFAVLEYAGSFKGLIHRQSVKKSYEDIKILAKEAFTSKFSVCPRVVQSRGVDQIHLLLLKLEVVRVFSNEGVLHLKQERNEQGQTVLKLVPATFEGNTYSINSMRPGDLAKLHRALREFDKVYPSFVDFDHALESDDFQEQILQCIEQYRQQGNLSDLSYKFYMRYLGKANHGMPNNKLFKLMKKLSIHATRPAYDQSLKLEHAIVAMDDRGILAKLTSVYYNDTDMYTDPVPEAVPVPIADAQVEIRLPVAEMPEYRTLSTQIRCNGVSAFNAAMSLAAPISKFYRRLWKICDIADDLDDVCEEVTELKRYIRKLKTQWDLMDDLQCIDEEIHFRQDLSLDEGKSHLDSGSEYDRGDAVVIEEEENASSEQSDSYSVLILSSGSEVDIE